MSYVVPSVAVELIDRLQEVFKSHHPDSNNLRVEDAELVAIVVGVVEKIPEELITLEGEDLVAYMAGFAALKNALHLWPGRGSTYIMAGSVPGFNGGNAIQILRESLAKCPDTSPSKETADLSFLSSSADKDLRDSLRLDISTAYSALRNVEWKPATVMAGSVIEALLLWALQGKSLQDRNTAITTLRSGTPPKLGSNPHNDLLRWTMDELIKVADEMNIIQTDTAKQCDACREFRNLIHPGRVQRLGTRCSRGTAYASIGALEQVIEDLA